MACPSFASNCMRRWSSAVRRNPYRLSLSPASASAAHIDGQNSVLCISSISLVCDCPARSFDCCGDTRMRPCKCGPFTANAMARLMAHGSGNGLGYTRSGPVDARVIRGIHPRTRRTKGQQAVGTAVYDRCARLETAQQEYERRRRHQ